LNKLNSLFIVASSDSEHSLSFSERVGREIPVETKPTKVAAK
jgi:hypothetical protein